MFLSSLLLRAKVRIPGYNGIAYPKQNTSHLQVPRTGAPLVRRDVCKNPNQEYLLCCPAIPKQNSDDLWKLPEKNPYSEPSSGAVTHSCELSLFKMSIFCI